MEALLPLLDEENNAGKKLTHQDENRLCPELTGQYGSGAALINDQPTAWKLQKSRNSFLVEEGPVKNLWAGL